MLSPPELLLIFSCNAFFFFFKSRDLAHVKSAFISELGVEGREERRDRKNCYLELTCRSTAKDAWRWEQK